MEHESNTMEHQYPPLQHQIMHHIVAVRSHKQPNLLSKHCVHHQSPPAQLVTAAQISK